ncbi:hypothetical protein [Dyadobacter sp. MSC1_007]|uniref:hypothetical protein n=1 Tax=Dyadobacter sp. MSC1_007 TaxID=2909264 RepID=UPI0020300BB4|nr:hypothetical protein [Dyadobacter sp. MSC1_007]
MPETDEDGEPISAILQYKESTEPETANKLPKGISEDAVIARFYDHVWELNALITYTDKSKTKASYYRIYKERTVRAEITSIGKCGLPGQRNWREVPGICR